MSDLSNRVVVVTGSSTGIGAATAMRCFESGASVVIHGRTLSAELNLIAQNIDPEYERLCMLPCDFSNIESLVPFVEECWKWKGRVDSWINVAGADILTGVARNEPFEKKLERLWQVDVRATTLLCREIGERMRAAGSKPTGHYSIVNIGWDQADQGFEGESGQLFGMTKGAVIALTKSLAQEYAPSVRVNCVSPGWIMTEWSNKASVYWQQRAQTESLMRRWGTPQDVADTLCFLASDKASFVSGQNWKINGGFRFGLKETAQNKFGS